MPPPPDQLIGIARMAAESVPLDQKRRVTYNEIAARSYLSRVPHARVPFRWQINPYRGCEFGCKYCYARYTHEFMELRDPEEFERRIFVKTFDAQQFRNELRRLPIGETIAIGTATDPYQPAERRYRVTRQMLEVLASVNGLKVGITTKSDLVARDVDVLSDVAARHFLSIHATVTTVDPELARLIEPYTPRPDLRLKAVRRLASHGIRVMVFCAPVLPLINDSERSLDPLAGAAAAAGACVFGANVLFLKPSAQAVFLPFLEERFPSLVRKYRERFQRSAFLRGSYPDLIQERVHRIRTKYGLQPGAVAPIPKYWPTEEQLELFV